jgi:hypothetical protein
MQRRLLGVCLIAVVVTLPACVRHVLNMEQTFTLESGMVQSFTIEPISREQKIKVEVTSTNTPVSVYVVLEKDKDKASNEVKNRSGRPPSALASAEKTTGHSFEATIPENTSAVVLVGRASKETQVTIKLTN